MGMLLVMEMERQSAFKSPKVQEPPKEVVDNSCGVADVAPQEIKLKEEPKKHKGGRPRK